MPIPTKRSVSMETQHLMTDNRERPGKKRMKARVESAREPKKTLTERERERRGKKDADLVEQKEQFRIGGQREA